MAKKKPPREYHAQPGEVVLQFVKGVSGPPIDRSWDPQMQKTYQDERVRRQKAAHIRPSKKGK